MKQYGFGSRAPRWKRRVDKPQINRNYGWHPTRRNIAVENLLSLRRRNLDPSRLLTFNPDNSQDHDCSYCRGIEKKSYLRRRNPDPEGKPWGPQLYNPLLDKGHEFKNESHYQRMIAKVRRNPVGCGMKNPKLHVGVTPKSNVWRCPSCQRVNAWNWSDAGKAEKSLGEEVKVSHGSAFDNVCGHCNSDFVARNSPIMAKAYTHTQRRLRRRNPWRNY